jgi:hypothetical protein
MSVKGKMVKMPASQIGSVPLQEVEGSFNSNKLYEIAAWLDLMSYHNGVVPQPVQRWFSKNKSALVKVFGEHEKSREALINEGIKTFYPEENNGEEIYIQNGHPTVTYDENGKAFGKVVNVNGVDVLDKGKYIKSGNNQVKFVSVYTDNDLQKDRHLFKPELKDESLRPEFTAKIEELTQWAEKTLYPIKIFKLPAVYAQDLQYANVYANGALVDPLFVEEVIYQYFISE